ncbi:Aste57867_9708 [Aphanomyces stellatus]|uniref:Aste57867_9708 protein n=1 Tax=Aphanomyces stellatus TaxID=120398 RepID=A0A485KP71_9STRA|nr:hypothetical protein As57867_009670 [Aphanomyces stellatus]VFT86587.1 Aste57867_9708 [Aphanomyces stellatus]
MLRFLQVPPTHTHSVLHACIDEPIVLRTLLVNARVLVRIQAPRRLMDNPSFAVENPYTLETVCEVGVHSEKASHDILGRVKQAQRDWAAVSLDERKAVCTKWVEVLEANIDTIAQDISRQMGKPLGQAVGEVRGTMQRAKIMIGLADKALAPTTFPTDPTLFRQITKEPIGVVFCIAPWNYPMMTVVNSVIPALLAGNGVLLKHSPQTPLCGDHYESTLAQAGVPRDLLRSVHCSHETAASLIANQLINFVSFTGSVRGGAQVNATVGAKRFIGSTLELGGKDAMYVAPDADIDAAAAGLVDGACYNAGQSCCGVERVYVHRSKYEEFIAAAVPHFDAYSLGNPLDASTSLGPMALASGPAVLARHVKDAVAKGGKVVTAVQAPVESTDKAGHGRFFPPTLVRDATHEMAIMTEESFGPILGVMAVDSDEDAIAKMNDSAYGLTAGIFTRDFERAQRMAKQLEAGTIYMNRCDAVDAYLPWTGVKDTGKGHSLSEHGFAAFTQLKSVVEHEALIAKLTSSSPTAHSS